MIITAEISSSLTQPYLDTSVACAARSLCPLRPHRNRDPQRSPSPRPCGHGEAAPRLKCFHALSSRDVRRIDPSTNLTEAAPCSHHATRHESFLFLFFFRFEIRIGMNLRIRRCHAAEKFTTAGGSETVGDSPTRRITRSVSMWLQVSQLTVICSHRVY